MKKLFLIISCFSFPLFLYSQAVEIQGELIITEVDNSSSDSLLVLNPDGTIGKRQSSGLPKELPTNPAAGTLLVYDGTSWVELNPGQNGQILQISNEFPYWTDQDIEEEGCDLAIGEYHEGGYIFYLDASGCHGLICDIADLNNTWRDNTEENTFAYGSGVGSGRENTYSIFRWQGHGNYAAKDCIDLAGANSDWYLPSRYELNLMFSNLHMHEMGDFADLLYWSSTELDTDNTWVQDFETGEQLFIEKDESHVFRPVKAF